MHFFYGLINQSLSCFKQVKILNLDRLSSFFLVVGMDSPCSLQASHCFLGTESLVHPIVVSIDVVDYPIYPILNGVGQVDCNWNRSVLAQVLTQVWELNISRVLPAWVIVQKIERKHTSSKCFSVWVILKRPLHDFAACKRVWEVNSSPTLYSPILSLAFIWALIWPVSVSSPFIEVALSFKILCVVLVVKQLFDNIKTSLDFMEERIILWVKSRRTVYELDLLISIQPRWVNWVVQIASLMVLCGSIIKIYSICGLETHINHEWQPWSRVYAKHKGFVNLPQYLLVVDSVLLDSFIFFRLLSLSKFAAVCGSFSRQILVRNTGILPSIAPDHPRDMIWCRWAPVASLGPRSLVFHSELCQTSWVLSIGVYRFDLTYLFRVTHLRFIKLFQIILYLWFQKFTRL